MGAGEFQLIENCFQGRGGKPRPFTRLGIGDDASVHAVPAGMELVVSSDTSMAGIHWPDDFPLEAAADRAVCAALSDLAAMGAEPAAVWLNVMARDSEAVEGIGRGAVAALVRYDVELAGGDTCRSSCNGLSVTVAGCLPAGEAMRRDRAAAGDELWLLGDVGLSRLGLQQWLAGERAGAFVGSFTHVVPQLAAGMQLRQQGVRCCIDISDGLLQDAGHIARASQVQLQIELTALPGWARFCGDVGEPAAMQAMISGGEDYALLFAAPAGSSWVELGASRIGRCVQGDGVELLRDGRGIELAARGFDHFD